MNFKLVVLALVALPLISGCVTTNSNDAYINSTSNYGKKSIDVELVNVELALTVSGKKLSEKNLASIKNFLLQQGSSYKQHIVVNGSQRNLVRYLPQLSQLLIKQGIGQDKQRFQPQSELAGNQLVLISEYFQAIAPSCQGKLMADVGCANSRNLAMMVVDPAQLLRAAPRAPTDANKAVSAIKAYRTAEPAQSISLTDFIGGN